MIAQLLQELKGCPFAGNHQA